MSESNKAVFLSYASEDAGAARRICEALRAAGIDVWFDQSELRGGDAWDQKIHHQIRDCALFVPIISANTAARPEGYFRLEWRLAEQRTHLMARNKCFVVPVAIDATPDRGADVPESFVSVQWTRLPGGETPESFCRHVAQLLAGSEPAGNAPAGDTPVASIPRSGGGSGWRIALAVAVVLASAVALVWWWLMRAKPHAVLAAPGAVPAQAAAVPANSIAVLPFADLSARKDQEYFSDGLAEELLNLLGKVSGLQVAARTSAFSFKNHAVDVPTIGRQLMVAHVLEGSVRKVGNHLRVTAQLVRTDNGYEVWSESYDRDLVDVFRMQDEIAAAVVKALKLKLLGAVAPHSTGTKNPDAYLVFLQGRAKMASQRLADTTGARADFTRALKLDSNFGPAYVELAAAKLQLAEFEVSGNRQAAFDAAIAEGKLLVERALALDPADAQAYVERAYLRAFSDLRGAEQDYRRGIELNPNSARGYDGLAAVLYEDPRRRDEALAMLDRARRLDPLEPKYDVLKSIILDYGRSDLRAAEAILTAVVARHPLYPPGLMRLAEVLSAEGRYAEAVLYGEQALKLDPLSEWALRSLILNYLSAGDPAAARRVAEQAPHRLPVQRLDLLILDGDWRDAAEVSYAALVDGTMLPISEPFGNLALRMDARSTHDFARARVALERLSGVTWSIGGVPTLPTQLGLASASVALGDLLILSGERQRGERLLRASLADMDYVARDLKRGDLWYLNERAIALALLGDRKAALVALRRAGSVGHVSTWLFLTLDPAFAAFHGDAQYQEIVQQMRGKIALERQKLDRLRAEGRVPARAGPAAPERPSPKAP